MKNTILVSVVAVALVALVACAAKGPLAKAQVVAVSIGQGAHEIRVVESGLYAQQRYDASTHLTLLERGVLPVLEAATAFERAVAVCTAAPCANVDQAQQALLTALDQLDQITPKVDAVRVPIAAAVAAVRVLLAKHVALSAVPPVQQAQEIPTGGVLAVLAVAEWLAAAFVRVRAKLKQDGATPEQLAAVDAMLVNDQAEVNAEIAAIKAQQAG